MCIDDCMTFQVMKPTSQQHQRLRMGHSEAVVVVDPETNRLLKFYEPEFAGNTPGTFKIDAALFSERDGVQIRTDLMDTHISICAPEVLMLFTDNFDFANLKKDFIPGEEHTSMSPCFVRKGP